MIICGFVQLQEVTPNIYLLFEKSDWWQAYKCSLPHKMAMERSYYCMQVQNISQTETVMEIPYYCMQG
jgi:hypothetical protein